MCSCNPHHSVTLSRVSCSYRIDLRADTSKSSLAMKSPEPRKKATPALAERSPSRGSSCSKSRRDKPRPLSPLPHNWVENIWAAAAEDATSNVTREEFQPLDSKRCGAELVVCCLHVHTHVYDDVHWPCWVAQVHAHQVASPVICVGAAPLEAEAVPTAARHELCSQLLPQPVPCVCKCAQRKVHGLPRVDLCHEVRFMRRSAQPWYLRVW